MKRIQKPTKFTVANLSEMAFYQSNREVYKQSTKVTVRYTITQVKNLPKQPHQPPESEETYQSNRVETLKPTKLTVHSNSLKRN